MPVTRREFVKIGAMAGAGVMLARGRAYAAWGVQTPALRLFSHPLRTLADMAPASPVSSYAGTSAYPGVDYYEIAMREFSDHLHPDFKDVNLAPLKTRLWGYGNKSAAEGDFRHLGGSVVANRGTAVRVRFSNELPSSHLFSSCVDNTVPGLRPEVAALQNRATVHLHGGHVPWVSDGGPYHWFTPEGTTGASVPIGGWLPDPITGAYTNDYWYPNDQSARLMWYHDHAIGNTRLNAYAGLASGYILRDPAEQLLINSGALPGPDREIPLVFQDKIFTPDGQLWYPDTYNQLFFGPPAPAPNPLPIQSLNPEFWGDTMLVNGTVSPFVEVQPRRYRFRILNACNTRFLRLSLMRAAGKAFPDNTEPSLRDPGPALQLIGTEGGFLDPVANPQGLLLPGGAPLVLAPAERADVLIDFSKVKPGSYLIFSNDAAVPFPGGTPLADFYPQNRKLGTPPTPGFAPNTRSVLQFRVGPLVGAADAPVPATWTLPPLDPTLNAAWGTIPPGAKVRDLTLNEAFDEYGRLAQLLGGVQLQADGGFGLTSDATASETPDAGATEVWNIYNLTADAHPIHFHLANAQVVSRQPFNMRQFTGVPSWTAKPRPADPDEMGWKETVKMYSGECTTVVMKFDLPPDPVIPVGGSPRAITVPESGRTGGYEYVWHCHILEHEEHDMMRPMVVTPPPASKPRP